MIPRYDLIRFGTSSWAYEGWRGLVYHRPYTKNRFSQDTLNEYAAYTVKSVQESPLFRTVGIDHSFYRPATVAQLAHYANQVPEDFRFCQKVWEEMTIPVYATLPRYGTKAGKPNARFLDASAFRELIFEPAVEGLGQKLGPFLFEFQRWGLDPQSFLDQLDRFLGQLPSGFNYAVEVRNPVLLGERYRDILRAHTVSHIYNHWTDMPPLAVQHRLLGHVFTSSTVVIRLLTPLGLAYHKAVERYQPYQRLIQEQPRMRQETMDLVKHAIGEGKSTYVLVNNRSEGCSPLTIEALAAGLTNPDGRP